jgi:hypothetical protein
MKKIGLISAMCVLALSGCATTQKIVSKVDSTIHSPETPLEQVLKAQPDLKTELNPIEIRQVFNSVESPNVGQIVVLQAGLMDDSLSAIRTTYSFRLVDENWKLINKKEEYKCGRGENTKTFQTALCP